MSGVYLPGPGTSVDGSDTLETLLAKTDDGLFVFPSNDLVVLYCPGPGNSIEFDLIGFNREWIFAELVIDGISRIEYVPGPGVSLVMSRNLRLARTPKHELS